MSKKNLADWLEHALWNHPDNTDEDTPLIDSATVIHAQADALVVKYYLMGDEHDYPFYAEVRYHDQDWIAHDITEEYTS